MSLGLNKIDKKVVQFIVAEIIIALEYLHSIGVSHRDLKPENIFVNEIGHLKLGDFGCAGVSQEAREKLKIRNHKQKDNIMEEDKLNTFVNLRPLLIARPWCPVPPVVEG